MQTLRESSPAKQPPSGYYVVCKTAVQIRPLPIGATMNELTKAEFTSQVLAFEDEADLESQVPKNDKPVIVDFYADWCAPCKMVSPILEQLAKDFEGRIDFYKVDVDTQTDLAHLLTIRSIPTILFLSTDRKRRPHMESGATPRGRFLQIIEEEFNLTL